MPVYSYKCKACEKVVELFHSMSEIDNPSQELIENTSCFFNRDCASNWEVQLGMQNPSENDLRFQRQIFAPQILGSYNGSSLSGAEKRSTMQKIRRKRSHEDFKKNVFPNIPKPEQRFFEKKWKKTGE